MIGCCQLLPLRLGERISFKQSPVRCSCRVIDLVHFSPMPGLTHQLHYRLEEVHVEAEEIIDTIESFQGGTGAVTIIAY